MSFLIRCRFVLDDGTVMHDETTVSESPDIVLIEKGMHVFGQHGVLSISFDPPLVPDDICASKEQAL